MKTIKITVKGKVQGVFYRKSTHEEASKMDLYGYVKNLNSGDVEILVQGKKEDLEKLISWCHKGPELSKVTEVLIEDILNSQKLNEFEIKY